MAGKNVCLPAELQVARKHTMKLKFNFDKKAIGRFFLEHSEKMLLGAFILVFAIIIYGAAVRRDKFDKIPSELVANCGKAKQSLDGERPDLLNELLKEQQAREDKGDYKKEADKIAKFNEQGINVKPYECGALDKPLFGQRGKRGQPELYDVEELRAAADFGAFQVVDASSGGAPVAPPSRTGGRTPPVARAVGNTVIRGKHWVVITGLVPVDMQANAYRKALGDAVAYDPVNDVPTYVDYTVERAEINSPADEINPDFTKKFNSAEAENEAKKDWLQPQTEVVESKYTDPILTFPLGPLQNRAWGANVAHASKIPLLNSGMDGETGDRADAENPAAEAVPAADPHRGQTGIRGGPRNPNVRTDRGAGYGGEAAAYKLLRFFDFNVEPGKSYIYRVRLALKNPNFQVDAGKLEKAEFAQSKNLETPDLTQLNKIGTKSLDEIDKNDLQKLNIPQLRNLNISQLEKTDTTLLEKLDNGQLDKLDKTQKEVLQKLEPTQKEALQKWLSTVQSLKDVLKSNTISVYVPKDTQVLVGAAKPDDLGPGNFPVILLTWAQKSGRAGYYSITNVDHGQVLNLPTQTLIPATTDSPANTSSETEDIKAELITDATLLDMDGGKRFATGKGPKSTVPREMLFMVVNGKSINLMLRDELDDMSEINRIKSKPETAATHDKSAEEKLLDRGNPTGRGTARPR
jgi:hypothetical protein